MFSVKKMLNKFCINYHTPVSVSRIISLYHIWRQTICGVGAPRIFLPWGDLPHPLHGVGPMPQYVCVKEINAWVDVQPPIRSRAANSSEILR